MKKRHEIERFLDSFESLMNRMGTETHYHGHPRREDWEVFQEERPRFERVLRRDWKESEADLEVRTKELHRKFLRLLGDIGES